MALPATEPFTGTGALSASWTHQRNSIVRSAGQGKGNTNNQYNISFWNADVFNNDQYSQVVLATLGADGIDYAGPSVRAAGVATTDNWYGQFCTGSDNDLLKSVNGTITTIANNLIATVANGDIIKLTVEGTTLKSYKNGVQQGANQTDASLASGSAGVVDFDNNIFVDNWEGGNLAAGGGEPAPAVTTTILRRTLSDLGTRSGTRQVQMC